MVSDYEAKQTAEIEAWKRAKPSILQRRFGKLSARADWIIDRVVPYIPLGQAFDWLDATALRMVDERDLLKSAGVTDLEDLRSMDLALSDRLAENNHRWAVGVGAAEGAITGATGMMGLAADIPAIITLALRTIYRTGVCYGFDIRAQKGVALGILAVSGANSMAEKNQALSSLEQEHVVTLKAPDQRTQRIAESGDATRVTIKQVSQQLGTNLAKRKVLQTIPMLGAVVGGSVNAWYIRDVSWAARRVFQEQWLRQNHKLAHVAA